MQIRSTKVFYFEKYFENTISFCIFKILFRSILHITAYRTQHKGCIDLHLHAMQVDNMTFSYYANFTSETSKQHVYIYACCFNYLTHHVAT